MGKASFEERAEHVCLTKQDFNFRISPIVGRYFLHEAEEFVKVHFLQLTAKLAHESRTHVDMKVFKAVLFGQIGIPESKDALQLKFAEQQTVHPLEGKLQELYAGVVANVPCQVAVNAVHQFLETSHHALNPRLIGRVMILDSGQQVSQAPVHIRFHLLQSFIGTVIHNVTIEHGYG